jgi:hypothetical protein
MAQGNEPTEKIRNRARKSKLIAVLLGVFISPLAYVYIGKWTWAIVNFLTVNFALTGFVIVPIHTYVSISGAQREVSH